MSVNLNEESPVAVVPALANMKSGSAIPSAKLAEQTVDRLIQAGLLRADKRDAIIAKIGGGSMSSEDWKFEISLATAKASK